MVFGPIRVWENGHLARIDLVDPPARSRHLSAAVLFHELGNLLLHQRRSSRSRARLFISSFPHPGDHTEVRS